MVKTWLAGNTYIFKLIRKTMHRTYIVPFIYKAMKEYSALYIAEWCNILFEKIKMKGWEIIQVN